MGDPLAGCRRGAHRGVIPVAKRASRLSMEATMRVMLAIVAAAAVMVAGAPAAKALYQGPWCAVETGRNTGYWNCRMRTFEECRREVVAGNRGVCTQNPNWPGWYGNPVAGDAPRPVRKRRAR
jgi:hypothetical protein